MNTATIQISKAQRIFAGLYKGTFSNEARTNVRYVIEKMDQHTTENPEEFGMWRIDIDGDIGTELAYTLKDAKAAVEEIAAIYQ